MAQVTKEQIEHAKWLDLLTYMRLYEPHDLVRKGNDYCTKEHDSLTISENGLWHWFSRGIGGKTALQYLIKVKEMDFVDAVLHLCCNTPIQQSQSPPTNEEDNKKHKFILPKLYKDNDRVVEYLRVRKISDFTIDYCIDNKLLYESADYHNAVFVGYDSEGVARYAALRGTWRHMANSFKGEVAGSDKRFSFSVPAIKKSDKVIVTESAIDALSVATLMGNIGDVHYLSVGGVYVPKNADVELPIALEQYLKNYKEISKVELCPDYDNTGINSSLLYKKKIHQLGLNASIRLPKRGKDFNEYLEKSSHLL